MSFLGSLLGRLGGFIKPLASKGLSAISSGFGKLKSSLGSITSKIGSSLSNVGKEDAPKASTPSSVYKLNLSPTIYQAPQQEQHKEDIQQEENLQ